MNKLGIVFACCGVFFGLLALVSNEGAFACISSITAMSIGALLIEAIQLRGFASLINDANHTAK